MHVKDYIKIKYSIYCMQKNCYVLLSLRSFEYHSIAIEVIVLGDRRDRAILFKPVVERMTHFSLYRQPRSYRNQTLVIDWTYRLLFHGIHSFHHIIPNATLTIKKTNNKINKTKQILCLKHQAVAKSGVCQVSKWREIKNHEIFRGA